VTTTTLITCHANADFDAFAAMLAARHLYASPVLLFPGTQERNLQQLFARLDTAALGFVESAAIDWEAVGRLVLVDTRQKSRVPHVAQLLARPDLEVELWDHHPDSPDDIHAPQTHLARTGAVTSLIVQTLDKRGITLDAEEATLLGLGIYGDTGSFTYSSTTREDFLAAAWLLGQGMDVNRIDALASHELTSLHIHALNSLLESTQTYTINNVQVAISEAAMEHYLGDFAYLAQRLMEMEKFQVLFAIGIMDDRIQVVARSRSEAVNVGDICAALGGGGHTYAASASVRSMMAEEVRDVIIRNLYSQALPDKTAREYMSSPAVGIESRATIRQADELMLHFGLKSVPVFAPGTRRPTGLLDALTAMRAAAHGLGDSLVEEYMVRRVHTLPPEASLQELMGVIVGRHQRLVPIMDGENILGVVTRTDLINVFAEDPARMPDRAAAAGKERNISRAIMERLPATVRDLLQLAGRLGRELNMPVYAVGGFVRDLLMHKPNQDIDLVAEGNGIALARALAGELHGRVRVHPKFLTSMVIFHDAEGREQRIDVATARLEYYESPAALPTVELSSIKMDLYRRDFTINALALRLDSTPFGQIADFFGGRRDIKEKVIRVLHTLSFVEDPTRCLRAVRFEQRYGFHIGQGSEKLIKNALKLKLLDRLSPFRLFHEFQHICEEQDPLACLERLNQLGVLQAISPTLALNPARKALLQRIQDMLAWYRLLYFEEQPQAWLVFFLGLNQNLNYADTAANYQRMGLPENRRADILNQREQARSLRTRLDAWQKDEAAGKARVSELCERLKPLTLDSLLYLMAGTTSEALQKSLSRYITQWRREKPDITGAELRATGLAPGPAYGRILRAVLRAKLDGEAPGVEQQLELARAMAREAAAGESEGSAVP